MAFHESFLFNFQFLVFQLIKILFHNFGRNLSNFMKNILLVFFFFILKIQAQHNVVLIIADDLGSDYCGFYENHVDTAKMPNIRKLLSRGIRFSQAWSNPVCSPTRAGILTGRYSFRTGIGDVVAGAGSKELDTSEKTIPKLLKSLSANKIKTANIGKWHLSMAKPVQLTYPNYFGFDQYAGNFSGALSSYTNWSKITNGASSLSTNYATSEQTDDAINWLKANKNQDKFLWLAYNAPHSPFHLPPLNLHSSKTLPGTTAHINANPKLYFKAMVEAMDTEIGRLIDSLKSWNMYDQTDIIFIGDNGDDAQVNQGNNSSKGTLFQDGIHVPMIVSGPSVVAPNRVNHSLVNTTDVFATVMELFGFSNWQTAMPTNKVVDSKSLFPIINNQSLKVRDWIFSEIFKTTSDANDGKTMRNSSHKLIDYDNGTQKFFNLKTDSFEQLNLIGSQFSPEDGLNYAILCQELVKLMGENRFCDDNVGSQSLSLKNNIYPNPFTSEIHLPKGMFGQFFQVYNALGLVVFEGYSSETIDLNNLNSGIYHLIFANFPKNNFVIVKKP